MKIYITTAAKQKLELYVDAVDDEISGLGKVRKIGRKIVIEEVYLLKQESSSSTTDLDMEAVAEFLVDKIDKGEEVGDLKLWWHSHGDMGAFWSGTDEQTVQSFENEWMVSLVVNRRSEYKCRLDVYDPVHLVVDDAELCLVVPEASAALKAAIKDEVDDKVKTKKFYQGKGYQGTHSFEEECLGRNGGCVDERDRRWGPVPHNIGPSGRIGVWKKDSHGVWQLASESDNKEEVSKTVEKTEKVEVKEENKGTTQEWDKERKVWRPIGFRQSEK